MSQRRGRARLPCRAPGVSASRPRSSSSASSRSSSWPSVRRCAAPPAATHCRARARPLSPAELVHGWTLVLLAVAHTGALAEACAGAAPRLRPC